MDIGGWLRSLGLERYEAAFRENEVDETVLPSTRSESSHVLPQLRAILSVLLAAFSAPEGIQIGQVAKSSRSSNEFHRLGAAQAARWTRRLESGSASAFVTHDTVSHNCLGIEADDMRHGRYRELTGGLTFGNPSSHYRELMVMT
jgi:SAM domain (Sterile alpha motif)